LFVCIIQLATVQTDHVASDATKEVISNIWQTTNIDEFPNKDNPNKCVESISPSKTSKSPNPRLNLKRTQPAIVRTNEEFASENDS